MGNGKLKMGVKAAVGAAMLWLCLTAPAVFAGALEDGLAAAQRKDYATALRLWHPLAEKGNAAAQYNLGVMYGEGGHGVPQDYAQALIWYRKAAEQGVAKAQNNLGSMYRNSHGVPQDYEQALSWYRKAAEQGGAEAQSALGGVYHMGKGVPQDYMQAVAWYRKAAEQGNAGAQSELGVMYNNGQGGVPQDYVQAHLWSNLAAAGFSAAMVDMRNEAADNREKIAAKMTPAQIVEAQRLAREWKPK